MTNRAAAAGRTTGLRHRSDPGRPRPGRAIGWLATLAALTMTTMAFAFTGAAQAATTWGGATSVDGNGGPVLSAACPSTTQCTAVDLGGQEITFNPQSGTTQAPVNVDGVNLLRAIACVSTSLCTGVDDHGMGVSFDPTTGTIVAGPTQLDPDNVFYGISCAPGQTTQCVGLDRNGMATTFNPNTLAVTVAPTVIDTNLSTERLSCISTTQCTAVDDSGHAVTFNPTAGTITVGPTVIDAAVSHNLYVVSCPAGSSQCTAIDSGGNEITFNPTTLTSPNLANIDANPLYSVSCFDTTHCTAVDNSGFQLSFNPTQATPTVTTLKVDTTTFGAMHSVACPSATQCTATDNDGNEDTFTAPSGTPHTTVAVAPGNALTAVSCASSTQCTGADLAGQSVTFDPANGSIVHGPTSIDLNNFFYGVSCPSTSVCTAVDEAGQGVDFNPTTVAQNGGVTLTLDSGADFGGVSCVSATQCTAVDLSGNEVTYNPTASTITKTAAAIDTVPPQKFLQAVSCPSAGQCTAVDVNGEVFTFAPTTGAITQQVTIAAGHSLTGVSCPSTAQCTAVDSAGNQFTFNPLSVGTPTAQSIDTSALHGVSCSSATLCLAVDLSGRAVEFDPQVAGGTVEAISGAGPLEAISCTSALQCVAVDNSGHEAQGTASPLAGVPVDSALPTITGAAAVGQTLTDVHGTWTNSPISFTYQWERCDSAGANCAAISGATAQTYVVTSADETHTIRVIETAANGGGSGAGATSAQTAAVPTPTPPAPASSTPPTITGTAKVGKTLTESHATWSNSPTGYTYQWERCNKSGALCGAITGATGQTYKLTSQDVGHTLKVIEVASNAGGAGGAATSVATAAVEPAAPTIGTLKLTIKGQTLTIHLKAHGSATGYECALVLKPTGKHHKAPKIKWVHCHATKTYSHLKAGSYTLSVRAVGPGGTGATTRRTFHIKK